MQMQHRNSGHSVSSFDSNSSNTTLPSPILFSEPLKKGDIKKEKSKLIFENQVDPKYKTELCKTFSEKSYCPYGIKCRFAHGKEELFNKVINSKMYKQKNCISFFNNNYCTYGSRCYFKHDERKIEDIISTYYNHLLDNISLINHEEINKMSEFELVHYVFRNTPEHIRTFKSKLLF